MALDIANWTTAIGALVIGAAVYAYIRDTTRAMFPVVLALAGTFIIGAQTIRASISGVGDIEFSRNVVAASDANANALLAQQAAIEAIGKDLKIFQEAFTAFQSQTNQRLAALGGGGRPPRDLAVFDASALVLSSKLVAVSKAAAPVTEANRKLKLSSQRLK